eukprot:14700144-Alexandrium_andersonii.AAC.1
MSASLVGSEMCIRDSAWGPLRTEAPQAPSGRRGSTAAPLAGPRRHLKGCLLYTSDAADDM